MSDDPWLVSTHNIEGVVVGKIRGFGYPLLLWHSIVAAFTSSKTLGSAISSTYWQQATMSWTIYKNAASITATVPNYVSMLGNGDRKVWVYKTIPYHVHFYGRLSAVDSIQPTLQFVISGCVNTNDDISCGLVVQFNDTTKTVSLRVVNLSGIGATIASSSFNAAMTSSQHISIYRASNSVVVQLNGLVVLSVTDIFNTAKGLNITYGSGNYSGFWLRGLNQTTSARINIW